MFRRISRLISAFFNRLFGKIEDPTLLLEQSINELQGLIPELNHSVAVSSAAVIQLQKELAKFEEEEKSLDLKIRAALQLGENAAARDLAVKLQGVKSRIAKLEESLKLAQQNLQSVQKVRDLRVTEIKQKQEEIQSKISEHQFSQVQSKIAQALDSSVALDTNSVSMEVDKQLQKLEEQTNLNQATFAASLQNNREDISAFEIDRKAKEMEADVLLENYIKDMEKDKAGSRVTIDL